VPGRAPALPVEELGFPVALQRLERAAVQVDGPAAAPPCVPTPVLYFAAVRYRTDGGFQITGSHNPPEYNGFKMVMGGRSLYGQAIQRLRERIENGEFTSGAGERTQRDALTPYLEDVGGRFSLRRPVKVVVDCGNGTGSVIAVPLLERIGAEVEMLLYHKDSPDAPPPGMLQPGFEDKVMHATLNIGGSIVMASDGCDDTAPTFHGISLSLCLPSEEAVNKAFAALAEGGQVTMPVTKTFWSPCFGMVTDRFGLGWMVTVATKPE
jgi:PhnB protein